MEGPESVFVERGTPSSVASLNLGTGWHNDDLVLNWGFTGSGSPPTFPITLEFGKRPLSSGS